MDDPAERMRLARRLAAWTLGVHALPPDADVEMALDAGGNLHVRGVVTVPAKLGGIQVLVRLEPQGAADAERSRNDA